ncbi:hypothetical protein Dred_0854 [Desulforamulus reducens MI-1]|uniref:Amidoligase enzyme n=1 Tax=Desulforamulus reducens (strain ATCC BAA-1160 / DSM 100696 / MI-1) TaxID=349161 RepID=A4J2T9_DESRM|nr:hypothetical protein [Desulforamulus reducens]ABO49392.1 hypothetical protein Dred_0854 [Desulforamulus reducens MI-1]
MLKIKGMNIPRIKCVGCGAEIPEGMACGYCLGLLDEPKDYNYHSFEVVGNRRKNARSNIWGFGVEIETLSTSPKQLVLLKKGFTPCYDSSVTLEWKSPIFQSLVGFKGICKMIEKMDVEHGGSHVHISVKRKDLFEDYYKEIFYPLAEYLDGSAYYRIWGRQDNDYCELPGYPDSRYSWVNVQTKYNTVEWRLPKFLNAKQYYELVKWLINITWAVDNKLMKNQRPGDVGQWILRTYQEQMAA